MSLRWHHRLFPTSDQQASVHRQDARVKSPEHRGEAETSLWIIHTRKDYIKSIRWTATLWLHRPFSRQALWCTKRACPGLQFFSRIKIAQSGHPAPPAGHFVGGSIRLHVIRITGANFSWPLNTKLRQKNRWPLQQPILRSWQNTFLLAGMIYRDPSQQFYPSIELSWCPFSGKNM